MPNHLAALAALAVLAASPALAQEVAQARRCGAGGERDGRAVQSAAEHERAERLRRDERRCPEQGDHHGDGHDGPSSVVIGPVTDDR